ncbi:MAG: hypothetical protein V2I33_21770, partial [Kangiellaceae bacterium]|nr:hypothetical protein [Kangiellaceae bacterium]
QASILDVGSLTDLTDGGFEIVVYFVFGSISILIVFVVVSMTPLQRYLKSTFLCGWVIDFESYFILLFRCIFFVPNLFVLTSVFL